MSLANPIYDDITYLKGVGPKRAKQLKSYGIFYDQLVMGVGGGDRVVINDRKPNGERNTACAINLNRNEGIKLVKKSPDVIRALALQLHYRLSQRIFH